MRQNESNSLILTHFKTIYFIAKNDLAFSLTPKMYEFISAIGCQKIDHYKDRQDALEMVGYLSD